MPPVVAELIALLCDPDPQLRCRAAEGISELGNDGLPALDALTEAVDDLDPDVRIAAVRALGALDPRDAEMALGWAMTSDDLRVRLTAQSLLEGSAGQRGPDAKVWRDPSLSRDE